MWLLETSVKQKISDAMASGVVPSAEHVAFFGNGNLVSTIEGSRAVIKVQGVLTPSRDFFAMIFGGGNTTYPDIINALIAAEQDESITDIELSIDSPGGAVDGLFDTLAAIEAVKKPIVARVTNTAASAAFAIAAQADKIIAANRATKVGSVGIMTEMSTSEDSVCISSTDAPNKCPDVSTDAGVAVVREHLDALHELFVESIAGGRGTTVEKVNAEFGRGGIVLADDALKRGMIDGIATPTPVQTKTKPEAATMDLNTLKAQHADVFSAAVEEGMTKERDRVVAHLTMGEASGDMKTAVGAIKDGSDMTATLQAQYMTAALNRNDATNRQDDDNVAATATGNVAAAAADLTAAEKVLATVERNLGVK